MTGIATQGRHGASQWVSEYRVSYWKSGESEEDKREYVDSEAIFYPQSGLFGTGNYNRNFFTGVVTARYIKIHVVNWINFLSMRAGVLIYPESKILGNPENSQRSHSSIYGQG